MATLFGPVLQYRGHSDSGDSLQISILVAGDAMHAPEVTLLSGAGNPPASLTGPDRLLTSGDQAVYRYLSTIVLGASRTIEYRVDQRTFAFTVPGLGQAPRFAFASCNGFSSAKVEKSFNGDNARQRYANWTRLLQQHQQSSYQLLILGGDQVYGDMVLYEIEKHAQSMGWSKEEALTKGDAELRPLLDEFYFRLYLRSWSEPAIAAVLSSVPSIMMWDDHDIVDGWGSHPPALQNSAQYRAIFASATRAFLAFQHHTTTVEREELTRPYITHGTHTTAYRAGKCGFIVMDLRSERSDTRMMSETTATEMFHWLDTQSGLDHLFLISPVPVLHPSFHVMESALRILPGRQELEDDLRDQWSSKPHDGKRVQLIRRLFSFAHHNATRVTLISGDVHIAAHGVIESVKNGRRRNQDIINQLTSSGIVHPPPAGLVLYALNHLFEDEQEIDAWISGKMVRFPGTQSRFIGARNWLSVEPHERPAGERMDIWVKWYVEDELRPYERVIQGAET